MKYLKEKPKLVYYIISILMLLSGILSKNLLLLILAVGFAFMGITLKSK